ncbi:hypothetical protein LLT5_01665 [Lactococcus cremoris subsp. cremoris TIFN5]|nr:hypothetical protein LLT5_01665 [Lactococcus cremoris subsp. cremoris TIFN5]
MWALRGLFLLAQKLTLRVKKHLFFVPITKKSAQKMGDNSLKNLSIFFVQ